jgi:hypothetical protein
VLFAASALGAFDAVLAAAALRSGCELLLSADRAFATVPELPLASPADPGFLERVRSAAG